MNSICLVYQVPLFCSSGNLLFFSYIALLYRQCIFLRHSVFLITTNLKPVSHFWAVQKLWFEGLVSRLGQSKLCMFCLTIKPNVQASTADVGAVLYYSLYT